MSNRSSLVAFLAVVSLSAHADTRLGGSSGIPVPLPPSMGGTGATSASGARANLGISVGRNVVSDYNWTGDGATGAVTLTASSTAVTGAATSTNDIGKLFAIPGVGAGGGPFQTTISSIGQLAAAPTFSTGTWYATGEVCPVATPGSGVVPNDTFTISGSGYNAATICTVLSTGVASAVVNNPGAGIAAGTTDCIVTGQTSAPVDFSLRFAVSGDGLGTLLDFGYPGQYTTNPPDLTNAAVQSISPGCTGLTGATVTITMGVNLAVLTTQGNAATQPASTQTPSATSGAGTGVTFNVPYGQAGQAWWGTDNLNAIQVAAANAPAGQLYVPAGVYMSSCPPASNYWTFTNAVSLTGEVGQSIIRLSPSCVQPAQNHLFAYSGLSNFAWYGVILDINDSIFTAYNPLLRRLGAAVFILGNGSNAEFDQVQVINMRSGQAGIQGFWSTGQSFDRITVNNSKFVENTRQGNISHGVYLSWQPGANVTNCNGSNIVSIGTNLGFQCNGGSLINSDICCQGYGPGFAFGYNAANSGMNMTATGNKMHDANNSYEVGDADIPSGTESFCIRCTYHANYAWNNPGPGIKICGEHPIVTGNHLWDNGGATGPNKTSGSQKWQLNAGIVLLRQGATTTCNTNGAFISGNDAWDSYTWALANGYDTTGLAPTQFYAISTSGSTTGDLAKYEINNETAYNANNVTGGVFAAAPYGTLFLNGSETVAPLDGSNVTYTQFYTWAGASIATGITNYFYASGTVQASINISDAVPARGNFRNLSAKIVTAAVGAPVVVTFRAAPSYAPGGFADTALTCSIPVGQTTCSADVPQLRQAGDVYVVKVVNGSSSSTGLVQINFQYDRLQ